MSDWNRDIIEEFRVNVKARVAQGDEPDDIWSQPKQDCPQFAEYERQTSRGVIPSSCSKSARSSVVTHCDESYPRTGGASTSPSSTAAVDAASLWAGSSRSDISGSNTASGSSSLNIVHPLRRS